MDFISGLPRSRGYDTILVVVDRLSNYNHFILLKHPYTARSVAEIFVKDIMCLHEIPKSILSDRDPLFMSKLWQELFSQQGTELHMSSSLSVRYVLPYISRQKLVHDSCILAMYIL